MQSQLNHLFNSINAISNAKNLEDKYQFQINEQENRIAKQNEDYKVLEQEIAKLTGERDKFRNELSHIVEIKEKMEKDKVGY